QTDRGAAGRPLAHGSSRDLQLAMLVALYRARQTAAPAAAKCSAIAAPIPFEAPVTTATCPSNFFDIITPFFFTVTETGSGRARTRQFSGPAPFARSPSRPRRVPTARSRAGPGP